MQITPSNSTMDPSSSQSAQRDQPKDFDDINLQQLTHIPPRDYQVEALYHSLNGNIMVCFPTGTGKTLASFMAMRRIANKYPNKLIVFLAPKIVLVDQQCRQFQESNNFINYDNKRPIVSMSWNSQVDQYEKEKFQKKFLDKSEKGESYALFATPDSFLSLLRRKNKKLLLEDCSLLVFDEAHGASKKHPYAKIMKEFYEPLPEDKRPTVLALTASPSGREDLTETENQLEEICRIFNCTPFMPEIFQEGLETAKNKIDIEPIYLEPSQLEIEIKEAINNDLEEMFDEHFPDWY